MEVEEDELACVVLVLKSCCELTVTREYCLCLDHLSSLISFHWTGRGSVFTKRLASLYHTPTLLSCLVNQC
jgi:hypothetical protein